MTQKEMSGLFKVSDYKIHAIGDQLVWCRHVYLIVLQTETAQIDQSKHIFSISSKSHLSKVVYLVPEYREVLINISGHSFTLL